MPKMKPTKFEIAIPNTIAVSKLISLLPNFVKKFLIRDIIYILFLFSILWLGVISALPVSYFLYIYNNTKVKKVKFFKIYFLFASAPLTIRTGNGALQTIMKNLRTILILTYINIITQI